MSCAQLSTPAVSPPYIIMTENIIVPYLIIIPRQTDWLNLLQLYFDNIDQINSVLDNSIQNNND